MSSDCEGFLAFGCSCSYFLAQIYCPSLFWLMKIWLSIGKSKLLCAQCAVHAFDACYAFTLNFISTILLLCVHILKKNKLKACSWIVGYGDGAVTEDCTRSCGKKFYIFSLLITNVAELQIGHLFLVLDIVGSCNTVMHSFPFSVYIRIQDRRMSLFSRVLSCLDGHLCRHEKTQNEILCIHSV